MRSCCPVVELRQYTLKAGQRDLLIDLFDRHFIESQEAVGMTVIGQFRDRRRSDRFVWLRGFPDMEARHMALEAFYGGPVWAAHKNSANDTMLDSDDVLLLRPARPDLAFQTDSAEQAVRQHERVLRNHHAGIYQIPDPIGNALVANFDRDVLPALLARGIDIAAVLVTEYAQNTFTRLPVREGEHVLAWFGAMKAGEDVPSGIDHILPALNGHAPSVLVLDPTSRSALGNGPLAARATRRDLD